MTAGGSESHTLSTAQIPSHSHANTLNDPSHKHGVSGGVWGGTGNQLVDYTDPDVTAPTTASAVQINYAYTGITITNASTGGGNAHNNVQPTMICNYILYAGA